MLQTQKTHLSAQAKHERLLTRLDRGYAAFLVVGYLMLGVYLLAVKPNATEAQRLYGAMVLTAIASGSAGYAFGKK